MKGEAEAFAIQAKAKAEAEQLVKKAEAWKEYQDAAIIDMVLETLPKVICCFVSSARSSRYFSLCYLSPAMPRSLPAYLFNARYSRSGHFFILSLAS